MLTSAQIFASKIFFLTWFKLSSETKLKKCVFKLSSFYSFIKSESLNHVRQDLIFSHFSWALHGVLAPKTNFFFHLSQFPLALTATNSQYGHNTQRMKILLLLKCIGASDWSRDWWTTNQNDCLISSYDVLSVSWELRKHKVHCTLSHYPTCTWILTIKMISKLHVSPKFGRSWIKQLCWGKECKAKIKR